MGDNVKILRVTLTRQNEYMNQGYLDTATILLPGGLSGYEGIKPGEAFTYGFERDWVVQEVEPLTPVKQPARSLLDAAQMLRSVHDAIEVSYPEIQPIRAPRSPWGKRLYSALQELESATVRVRACVAKAPVHSLKRGW